jgi:hypothetical protein
MRSGDAVAFEPYDRLLKGDSSVTTGDTLALISLVFTIVTTIGVLYLAYAALRQTARPNLAVSMSRPDSGQCQTASCRWFVFEFVNRGHWYGKPMAVDVTAYCNFPAGFTLHEIRYGSVQEYSDSKVRKSSHGMQYLKAQGLKLACPEPGEEVHVLATAPSAAGCYRIRVTAFSANDASVSQEFELTCTSA